MLSGCVGGAAETGPPQAGIPALAEWRLVARPAVVRVPEYSRAADDALVVLACKLSPSGQVGEADRRGIPLPTADDPIMKVTPFWLVGSTNSRKQRSNATSWLW